MADLLLTEEEWAMLSPESRHKINVMIHDVIKFVRSLYEKQSDADWKLRELGVYPKE